MVLGCTLAGLANHVLYMHSPASPEGHVLGLTGRFAKLHHTASERLVCGPWKLEASTQLP